MKNKNKNKNKMYMFGFVLPWRYKKFKKEWESKEENKGKEFEVWHYKPNKLERGIRKVLDFFKYIPICIKNFFFCLKYPFWRATNYRCTWYDHIEWGWRKAFGKQLSNDIKAAFKEDKKINPNLKWKDALRWEQIKEKLATLRLYASATENIMKVLNHYEYISEGYCIKCGKPAEYKTGGWIIPVCSECFDSICKTETYKKLYYKKLNDDENDESYEKNYMAYKEAHKTNVKPSPEIVIPLYLKKKRKK